MRISKTTSILLIEFKFLPNYKLNMRTSLFNHIIHTNSHLNPFIFEFQMPPRKVRQTVIGGTGFVGSKLLTLEDVKKIEVEHINHIPDKLLLNWSGGIVGITAIYLTNDNRRVSNSNFLLMGNIFSTAPKITAATKFWDMPASVNLAIQEIDTAIFIFNGTLSSELVDCSEINYSLLMGADPITDEDLEDMNFLGFSLRAFITPISQEKAKLNLVLYPLAKASLLETHPLAQKPQFPGINVYTADFNFAPLANASLTGHGLPFLPALFSSQPFASLPNHPSAQDLKAAISALLRKTTKPECKMNATMLRPRWEDILNEGLSLLKDLTPDLIWPLPRATTANQGMNSILFSYSTPPPLI